ncbi:MAG: transcriptional regulator [Xanthomonadales bacterium]|nr:transcriptional regulator [Xanthomonadales bacterium]NIX12119.1 transcriptional regulator [Xanthomonadales bacterium]
MKDQFPDRDPDRLLHEPARLRLLANLAVVRRADFTWLLNRTGLSRGNLSVQMSRLAEAGHVTVEKTFRDNRPRTLYELTDRGLQALREYKRDMARILDALPG